LSKLLAECRNNLEIYREQFPQTHFVVCGDAAAWSNPTRANSWLFHPNEISAMGWREEDGASHEIDQNAIPVGKPLAEF
jgi:hypothetical protein